MSTLSRPICKRFTRKKKTSLFFLCGLTPIQKATANGFNSRLKAFNKTSPTPSKLWIFRNLTFPFTRAWSRLCFQRRKAKGGTESAASRSDISRICFLVELMGAKNSTHWSLLTRISTWEIKSHLLLVFPTLIQECWGLSAILETKKLWKLLAQGKILVHQPKKAGSKKLTEYKSRKESYASRSVVWRFQL